MKPVKVTTLEQARALPEVESVFFDLRRTLLERDEPGVGKRGDTIIERVPRQICAHPVDGDQILLFVDSDGRPMQVTYTAEGPAKAPWYG